MSVLKSLLIVPDTHAPYHDQVAWDLMMRVGKKLKPDGIIIIGDFPDFYSVSSHSKTPDRALKLDKELAVANGMLDELDALKPAVKVYLGGNHEDRLERYLRDKAPELYPLITIPSVLRLDERGWEYVPYKDSTKIGKINFTHDVGSAGKYNVYRAMDVFQSSIVTGHTHRMAYLVEGDAGGSPQVSAQFGWLGDVEQVDYMNKTAAKRNWALGFGIGYLNEATGLVYLTPVPIVDHTCVVNGVFYG